jgi:hypothetical protein
MPNNRFKNSDVLNYNLDSIIGGFKHLFPALFSILKTGGLNELTLDLIFSDVKSIICIYFFYFFIIILLFGVDYLNYFKRSVTEFFPATCSYIEFERKKTEYLNTPISSNIKP